MSVESLCEQFSSLNLKMTEDVVEKVAVATQTPAKVLVKNVSANPGCNYNNPNRKFWMSKCKCAHHEAVQRFCPLRNLELRRARDRYATFGRGQWPHGDEISITELAEAGFYYTGERDAVRCFHCDLGMDNWEKGDDPAMEHIKYSRYCAFTLGSLSVLNVPILANPYEGLRNDEGMDVVD